VTATPGDVNVIAIEKIIPENIVIAVGILFYVTQTPNNPLTSDFRAFLVGCPF